ncbi:purple acid phosphatase family protein [Lichenicoccus sp.]|uniref:purple acid phosphatase family protein n=1 Tax=Lichenicoccus sp. TaxID=2781899 RepID=UPI003D11F93F
MRIQTKSGVAGTRRGLLGIAAGGAFAGLLRGTVPALARSPSLRFVSIGDWGRDGADDQARVGAQMGRSAASFGSQYTVSVGDNFYDDGVRSTTDPQWKRSFTSIYTHPSLSTPWHVILGNHDYRGSVEAQIAYTALDARWHLPARYYQTGRRLADGTRCDFFSIDTNPFIGRYRGTKVRIDGQDPHAQLAWLERALAASSASWKIVIGHHPLYTAHGGSRNEPELIAALEPMFRRHGVRVYINGHVHNLQHVSVDGIEYITNGAGSRIEGAQGGQGPGAMFLKHGFMTTDIDHSALDFAFVGDDGKTIYAASIPRIA